MKLDSKKDYLLFCLVAEFRSHLHIICSYMQDTTPYGEAYETAFDQYKKVQSEIDALETALQKCVEARG